MKKAEGKTPNGGDYSEIYYFTKDWKYTNDKDKAYYAIIRGCTKDGKTIKETYAEIS